MDDALQAELHGLDAAEMKDALVLVAFPTTGSAGPIAAQFLQRHFSLPRVGDVRIKGLNHLVTILDGIASSPVRVYGGEVECKIEGGCPRLYIITTEIVMPPELLRAIAECVLQAARDGGAKLLVCLEGVMRQDDDETPDVFVAGADAAALALMERHTELPKAGRALLTGLTSEILLRAEGLPAGAMIVEAARDYPDGRAAAALVHGLDKLIPEVTLDPEPLLEEAQELEAQIKAAQQQAAHQGAPMQSPQTFI